MTNLIGFTEDMVEKKNVPFPIACDNDNVKLTTLELEEGQYGPQIVMEFEREDADGNSQKIKGWKSVPTKSGSKPTNDMSAEEVYTDRSKKFNSYMRHIAKAVNVTEDELRDCYDGDSAKQTLINLCNLVEEKAEGERLYMKTLRKGQWAKIPPYPGFLENMSNGSCSLTYSNAELEDVKSPEEKSSVKADFQIG